MEEGKTHGKCHVQMLYLSYIHQLFLNLGVEHQLNFTDEIK